MIRTWGKFQPYGGAPVWVRMDTITSVVITGTSTVTVRAGSDDHNLLVEDAAAFTKTLMRDMSSITQRTRALTDYTGAVK
jgi:hypothetical protein